ncbi:hypothetical protein [Bradyrhizobium japonicum]|uniref:hypothetical protein n=1 Tax=Bradyrhizobium japonicum TaxID=375 RepID=UPI0020A1961D|nr:hypothetical protein [Bradyrhizobium japonicum]MCP1783898.1 hypothetical protein [Bradyrhizobium japonicum]MCP1963814.1 hypothetical protein [Bradyrhizobium japonicum]
MRAVFAVTIVVLTTTLAQGAEWLLPVLKDCGVGVDAFSTPQRCDYTNAVMFPDRIVKPESEVAKQVYTVPEVDGIKAALQGDIQTTKTELMTGLTSHKNEVKTALDGHKADVAGKLKGLITPELLAQIRKELVPEVTKEVMAELRKQGLLDRP